MTDLNEKNYLSSREASELTGYTSDYIGQLCRSGLVVCRKNGRGWQIDKEDIYR